MSVINITKDNFKQEVLEYDGEVVVDFYGSFCGPCKLILPFLDTISETSSVKIVKLEDTDNLSVFKQFDVKAVPTLIKFNKGEVVSRLSGAHPKSKLETFINS